MGQALATIVMLLGYSVLAVPTGILSAELSKVDKNEVNTIACPDCGSHGHDEDAVYCKFCGGQLFNSLGGKDGNPE